MTPSQADQSTSARQLTMSTSMPFAAHAGTAISSSHTKPAIESWLRNATRATSDLLDAAERLEQLVE